MAEMVLSGEGNKCNTCKAIFSSVEKVKEHYRSEWHIFNSKRRANDLLYLRKEDFKLLHVNKGLSSTTSNAPNLPKKDVNNSLKEHNSRIPDEDSLALSSPRIYEPKLDPTVSIFDDREFETVEDCVQYMGIEFGFFLPDIEYLCNLEGLLRYLNEKVKVGGVCLYCQQQCKPGLPTQHHMLSKSHCKIAYENGIDGEEFEDFYDFTASYEDLDEDDVELDENGDVVEKSLEIAPTGELILPNGKLVGHRDFRIYYKQRFRPDEMREAVLAQQREELLRLAYKFNEKGLSGVNDVSQLTDSEVMVKLIRYQKDVRRGMLIEQRSKQKADFLAQKREFNSVKDKLRSSENTTAKIRDYHKML